MFSKTLLKFGITGLILLACYNSNAQKNIVGVDLKTGIASALIPVGNVQSGSLSLPINLIYTSVGVKVKDVEDKAGMGWHLSAGGQISRELRGLPDDVNTDMQGHSRVGWLHNTNNNYVTNFNISNDDNLSSCNDELSDVGYLSGNFTDNVDTEPDIFHVNVPGLSFEFLFDKDHNIKTIPYRDVKITYVTDNNGKITQFTVINDKGITYTFSVTDQIERFTASVNENNINYKKKEYNQYTDGISFCGTWYLFSVTDQKNNYINLSYSDDQYEDVVTPINFYITDPNLAVTKATQYLIDEGHQPKTLVSIQGNSGSYTFEYSNNGFTNKTLLKSIKSNMLTYILNYSDVRYTKSDGNFYSRFFLRDFTTADCNTPIKYHFSYIGETAVTDAYNNINYYKTTLPDSSSKQIDYWGYFNNDTSPSATLYPGLLLNTSNSQFPRYQIISDNFSRPDYQTLGGGSSRMANPATVMTGTLNQVTYGDNASTTLVYESNDYYDVPASHVVQGSGIRVKSIIDYDGVDLSKNIITNYSYLNPSTGVTSGKPISLPVFAFTRPYNSQISGVNGYNIGTVRSDVDLSQEDHYVMYNYIRKSQAGAGSVLYEHFTPAMYWDNTASPVDNTANADWAPNKTYVARTNCTDIGYMSSYLNNYPFAPNTNYDFERGLLKKVTNYDEAGHETNETTYSYQRTGSPTIITGLRFEGMGNATLYSKYNIYASTDELMFKKEEKIYDSSTFTQSLQSSTTYSYGSLKHKLVTSESTTNSDGSIKRVFYKYVKDYDAVAGSDINTNALYFLQQQNVNIPVETYFQDERAGVNKTNSGFLIKFNAFTTAYNNVIYNVSQQFKFLSPDGVTDFTPSVVSGGVFTNDSRYYCVENDLVYDRSGFVQTQEGNNRKTQTTLTDVSTQLPIANIYNASVAEIGYLSMNNFADNTYFYRLAGNYNLTEKTRGGGQAQILETGATLARAIVKKNITKNYIFSAWVNTSVAATLTAVIVNDNNQSVSYNLPLMGSAQWKYYELKIPVNNVTQNFTIKLQGNHDIKLDELLFYPENAEVTTYAYDRNTRYKTAQTNTNGITQYYTFDQYGRLNYVFDQNKNMIIKKSYNFTDSYKTFYQPSFTYTPTQFLYPSTPITFSLINSLSTCQYAGASLSWNFGDGSQPVVATSYDQPTHVYAQTGTYTVTVTATSPDHVQVSSSMPITITAVPVSLGYQTQTTTEATFDFYQNGNLMYSITSADISSAFTTIQRGVYNVQVQIRNTATELDPNGSTDRLKIFIDGNLASCATFYLSGSMSYTWDLSNNSSLYFSIETGACN
jgi:hypothetical protein